MFCVDTVQVIHMHCVGTVWYCMETAWILSVFLWILHAMGTVDTACALCGYCMVLYCKGIVCVCVCVYGIAYQQAVDQQSPCRVLKVPLSLPPSVAA